MTIRELIDRLEDAKVDCGEDAEVRLMTQESWPFENAIRGVVAAFEIPKEDEAEDTDEDEADDIVYIVEGQQLCYGNKRAWDAAY